MSFGIGVVIHKKDLKKKKIRYDFCDWTIGITVQIHPESCRESFKDWSKQFDTETKTTSMDLLLRAPCDVVLIIDSDGTYDFLRDHKPTEGIMDYKGFLEGKIKL